MFRTAPVSAKVIWERHSGPDLPTNLELDPGSGKVDFNVAFPAEEEYGIRPSHTLGEVREAIRCMIDGSISRWPLCPSDLSLLSASRIPNPHPQAAVSTAPALRKSPRLRTQLAPPPSQERTLRTPQLRSSPERQVPAQPPPLFQERRAPAQPPSQLEQPPPQQPAPAASLSPLQQRPQQVISVSTDSPISVSTDPSKAPQGSTASSDPEEDGLVVDQQTLADIGMELKSRHNAHLSMDTIIDEFWSRVRKGYSHDPRFSNPDPRYRFDKRLQCYFLDHRLVIPDHDNLRKQILMWHHVHPWHAHMGVNRTKQLVMNSFFWPGISHDIADFISQCHSCQVMKSPGKHDTTLSPLPVPTACWRIVSLDMITQLPLTQSGFDCIVVFVDQFSKMARLIPAHSTLDGPGFAKLFFQHIYPHYGLPLGICSDRGVQWNNKFFKSICEHMGIDLRLTYSYHPRANGQVERLNRVIEEALRHFVSPAHDDWDAFLPHIEFSINSSHNAATGCTPFQLNRITPPLSPTAIAFDLPESHKLSPSVLHRMYYHLAKQSLSEAKQSMWSNKVDPSYLSRFQVGKPVLLSVSKLSTYHPSLRRKFTARWLGPCDIIELVGSRAARIKLPTTLQAHNLHDVFHFSCLKPYVDSHMHESPEESAAADNDKVFEVESIMDYTRSHTRRAESGRILRLGPHYKVRWKGYSSDHDLWLPVSELSGCLDKVAEYMFLNASPRQRTTMIDQFPEKDRSQLAHILQRAHNTRAGSNSGSPVMSGPPRQRRKGRQRKLPSPPAPTLKAALSHQTYCSVCGIKMF